MAITYHNSASNPADNGTNTTTPIVVTPPGSMATGDLVCFWASTRSGTATFAISEAGGQSWNAVTPVLYLTTTPVIAAQLFWCRYNGTWSANPSIAVTSGGQAWNGVMHVFRPSSGSNTWAVDQAMSELDFTGTVTVTITGQTTTQASTVTVAGLFLIDDVVISGLSGSGWAQSGSQQYRNTSGVDMSNSFFHKIQTSAGATGDFSVTQGAQGPDPGTSGIITFYETGGGGGAVVTSYLTLLGAG